MRERWKGMSRLARAVLIFTFGTSALLAAFAAALLWLPAIGSPSDDALHYSLSRRAGGGVLMASAYECERRTSDVRVCVVSDANGSGSGTYRVDLDGRCWQARKVTPNHYEEGPPYLKRRVSGCVGFRDQVRLVERALDG
jgi:membrane protein implicated in regulation of membrane protease activity